MTPRPIVLFEDSTVAEAAAKMLHFGFDHIPVVRHGKPVGIVAREDLLRLALRSFSAGAKEQATARGEDISATAGVRAGDPGMGRAQDVTG